MIGDIASRLARLAAVSNAAVLVTSHMVTKVRPGEPAVLKPAMHGQREWEDSMGSRVALFRDWAQSRKIEGTEEAEEPQKIPTKTTQHMSARFAEVTKARGNILPRRRIGDNIVAFQIVDEGLVELLDIMPCQPKAQIPSSSHAHDSADGMVAVKDGSRKRPHAELASSSGPEGASDDEYGWDEGDDDTAAVAAEGLVDETCLKLSSQTKTQDECAKD